MQAVRQSVLQKMVLFPRAENPSTKMDATEKSDVFSFASFLWAELSNKTPLENSYKCWRTTLKWLTEATSREPLPESWPAALKSLIMQCWEIDPEKRPSMEHVKTELAHILQTLELKNAEPNSSK